MRHARTSLACLGATLLAALIGATLPTTAATNTTVVSVTVPSATSLSTTACANNTPDMTSFGVVLPGSEAVTGLNCRLTFGSSNDTSRISVVQDDLAGSAMWRAAHGPLDTSFSAGDGSDGRFFSPFGGTNAEARDVAVQHVGARSGKPILAGWRTNGDVEAMLVRVDATTGAADPAFAGGSPRIDDFTAGADAWRATVVLPDDRIVAVGVANAASASDNGGDVVIARYLPDGTLDPSFSGGDGTNGYELRVAAGGDEYEDVVALDDGSVLVAGNYGGDAVVAKYTPTGVLDTTFGTGGICLMPVGGSYDDAEGIDVAPDGTIYVAGATNANGDDDGFFAKVSASGVQAAGWGGAGSELVVDVPQDGGDRTDHLYDVGVQATGRIIAVGTHYTATGNKGLVLAATPAGALDPTYGTGGVATHHALAGSSTTDTFFDRLLMHSDGTFAVIGRGRDLTDDQDMLVMRFLPAGGADPGFGAGDGIELLDYSGSTYARDIALGLDGTYLVAGEANGGMALMRLAALSVTDYVTPGNDWSGTGAMFGACLEATSGTAAWTDSADCTTKTLAHWRGIPAVTPSTIATNASGNATVDLRFGMQAPTGQPAGTYYAPLRFEVVAPAA